MLIIEGIDETIAVLRPHWNEIDAHFNRVNATFIELTSKGHDDIGRVLRAHLVIEHFLNQFLKTHFGFDDVDELRLNFSSKAAMLPKENSSATFVRPGIIELNAIRNKFAHRLDYAVNEKDIRAMMEIVRYTRPKEDFKTALDIIEAFLPAACAWLSIPPKHLQRVFDKAFSHARISPEY